MRIIVPSEIMAETKNICSLPSSIGKETRIERQGDEARIRRCVGERIVKTAGFTLHEIGDTSRDDDDSQSEAFGHHEDTVQTGGPTSVTAVDDTQNSCVSVVVRLRE